MTTKFLLIIILCCVTTIFIISVTESGFTCFGHNNPIIIGKLTELNVWNVISISDVWIIWFFVLDFFFSIKNRVKMEISWEKGQICIFILDFSTFGSKHLLQISGQFRKKYRGTIFRWFTGQNSTQKSECRNRASDKLTEQAVRLIHPKNRFTKNQHHWKFCGSKQ